MSEVPYPSPDPDPSHYCSAGLTWIWKVVTGHEPPYEWCCDEHDVAYGEAGEIDGFWAGVKARALADLRFYRCIKKTGHPGQAAGITLLVRLGGWVAWWT